MSWCVREDVHGLDGGEEGRRWRRRDRAGGAVSVARAVGFPTVRAAGGRGNAAVQGGFEIALLRAGGVGAAVLGFGVRTRAKGADSGVLASLFDMAKLPAVAALCERGGRVGAFDNTIFAVEPGEGGVSHSPAMFSGNLHYH